MQAHPQSTSAARIYMATPRIAPPLLSKDPEIATLVTAARRSSASPRSSTRPATLLGSAGRKPSQRELSSSVSEGAGLAHDAGNLLQALGLYCELLHVPGVLRPEHMHYASELRQLSERSSAMIRRLLKGFAAPPMAQPEAQPVASLLASASVALAPPALARPVSEPMPQPWLDSPKSVAPSCFNPAETLHQQSALLQRIAAPWAIISVMTQDALPGLEFSAEILERITVNLVLNAAEALRNAGEAPDPMRLRSVPQRSAAQTQTTDTSAAFTAAPTRETKAGRIRVSLRMAAGRLRLSVEDNGPGMPPGIAAAFLRPAPLPPGTARGLGHRIVHELAMATGGQLAIRVRPGTGTTFSLEWPVKLEHHPYCEGPTLRLVSSHRAFADLPARGSQVRTVNGGLDAC
jgi:signal transduction histidine kinase